VALRDVSSSQRPPCAKVNGHPTTTFLAKWEGNGGYDPNGSHMKQSDEGSYAGLGNWYFGTTGTHKHDGY